MRYAKEGYPIILGFWAVTLLALGVAMRLGGLWWALVVVLVPVATWSAYFFRDPERVGDRGEHLVVAPADGKVVLITEVEEPTFIGGPALRVSIFMTVLSVHVNRYPVSGTVRHVRRMAGRFLNAASVASSAENEQSSVGIETRRHRVLVRQIAGLIARRIITYSREGEQVHQGDRLGLIRFGSRVDVFLPPQSMLRVKLGALTSAGTTLLAELPA